MRMRMTTHTPPPHPIHINRPSRESELTKRSLDLTVGLIVILLNIIEIVMILRLKRKKNFEMVLLSLCVADLLFGLSNAIISVIFIGEFEGQAIFGITYTTYFFFVLTSLLHLLFIACDTLYAIVQPITHKFFMTKKKTIIFLIIIWFTSITTALSIYLSNEYGSLFDDEQKMQRPRHVHPHRKNFTGSSTVGPRHQTQSQLLVLTSSSGSKYKNFMNHLLSYFIIGATILLVSCYITITYFVKFRKLKSNQKETQNKVSLVCVFIATSFVAFTLPYAVKTLITGISGFEVNILLISNSGMNSIIYFFRNKCTKASKSKKKGGTPSGGLSTSTTPLSSRHEINSPYGTPKSIPKIQDKNRNLNRIEDIKLSEVTYR